MNNFQALDQTAFTFISIYLSTLIIIGFFGYRARQENTLKDFYLAGNGFGLAVIFLTFMPRNIAVIRYLVIRE